MPYFHKLLIDALAAEHADIEKRYFLFFLGTCVNFLEKPDVSKGYPRGETFSYLAQVQARLLNENNVNNPSHANDTKNNKYAHPFHSKSIDVINGPDTPGSEVGDRIAKGILLSLSALARGKTDFYVSGFSRGGAQAIVLMNELKRIKEAFETELKKPQAQQKSLERIIIDASASAQNRTRDILIFLFGSSQTHDQKLKVKLYQALTALKVKLLFPLDPVPGDNFLQYIPVGWYEDFYNLPDFVEQRFEFIQLNENSRCFIPIVPNDMPYEIIPGYHGTGDGSQSDHNGDALPTEKHDVSGVQDLVVRRYLDFVYPEAIDIEPLALGHEDLDKHTTNWLKADSNQRNQILFHNYEAIKENYEAFEWLSQRSYKGLGRYANERQVHFRNHGDTPISELHPYSQVKNFINIQHVLAWMHHFLHQENFFQLNLMEQLAWIQQTFELALDDSFVDLNSNGQKVFEAIRVENIHSIIADVLSALLVPICQSYFRNHLKNSEKILCIQHIDTIFDLISEEKIKSLEKNPQMLARLLRKTLLEGFTHNLISHYRAYLSSSFHLLKETEAMLEMAISSQQALQLLLRLQKSVTQLNHLPVQLEPLLKYCDQDALNKDLALLLPFQPKEANPSFIPILVVRETDLLYSKAALLLNQHLKEALSVCPESIDRRFYERIRKLAFAANGTLENEIANLTRHNLQQASHLKKKAYEISTLKKDKAELTHALESLESVANHYFHHTQNEINTLKTAFEYTQAKVHALQSRKEESAVKKLGLIEQKILSYQEHLRKHPDESDLYKKKMDFTTSMLDLINEAHYLPSQRLQRCKTKLIEAKETITAHRNCIFFRLIRDCLRIIATALSGIWAYNAYWDKSTHFFKPSHGEALVDSIDESLATTPTT